MELIRPMKQTVWEWPAVANFSLGGIGTGFYLLGLLIAALPGGDMSQSPLWNAVPSATLRTGFKLLGPALAGLGFLALTTEAGRPLRGLHLFRHLRRSWMSRETLAGAVFIPAAVVDWLFPYPALRTLAAIGAVGLMISQGFIVYRSRAVTAWNVPLMPLFFVTSAFATGCGLVLLLVPLSGMALGWNLMVIGLICVVLNLVVWLLYLRRAGDDFQEATQALRRPDALILMVGVGHLLPVLLLLLALLASGPDAGVGFQNIAAALAGLAMMAGGVSQKAGIILEAGYLRAIVLSSHRAIQLSSHPVIGPSSPDVR